MVADEKKKNTIDLDNELSDNDDSEMTDSQKTSKLSEICSTTIPSVDSAMDSWDGSTIDASYGSQSKFRTPTHKPYTQGFPCMIHLDIILHFPHRWLHPTGSRYRLTSTWVAQCQEQEQHPSSWPPQELPSEWWRIQWGGLGQACWVRLNLHTWRELDSRMGMSTHKSQLQSFMTTLYMCECLLLCILTTGVIQFSFQFKSNRI